jgi:hypothetical protein
MLPPEARGKPLGLQRGGAPQSGAARAVRATAGGRRARRLLLLASMRKLLCNAVITRKTPRRFHPFLTTQTVARLRPTRLPGPVLASSFLVSPYPRPAPRIVGSRLQLPRRRMRGLRPNNPAKINSISVDAFGVLARKAVVTIATVHRAPARAACHSAGRARSIAQRHAQNSSRWPGLGLG